MAYFAITITSLVCEFYRKLSIFTEGKYHKIALNILFYISQIRAYYFLEKKGHFSSPSPSS
jgi:hypothetical protein